MEENFKHKRIRRKTGITDISRNFDIHRIRGISEIRKFQFSESFEVNKINGKTGIRGISRNFEIIRKRGIGGIMWFCDHVMSPSTE